MVTPFLLFGSTQEEEMLNKLKKEEGGDKVGAWMQRLKKLPYFEAVNKEGLAKIGGLYKSKVWTANLHDSLWGLCKNSPN